MRWIELLVPAVQRRLNPKRAKGPDARATALVGSALACLDAANQARTQGGGKRDPAALFLEAVAAVRT